MISTELKHLARLLNDLQDQSIGSSEIAADFDVVLLACDLVTLIRSQIAKTIRLEVQASQSFWVHLPENILRQAILNLLLNAAEALKGRSFGQICIRIYKAGSGLTIQVLDNGNGFPQNMLDHGIAPLPVDDLFEIGNGLAMTQQWLKNIGAGIKLSNQLPHGACVSITLPDECLLTI